MFSRPVTILFGTILLISPAAAAAEILTVDAPITAITVFPDRAQVVRVGEVALPQGPTTVVIEGLPASIVAESVRVAGDASADVLIASVETGHVFIEQAAHLEERRLNDELAALKDQRLLLDDRIRAATIQLEFISAIKPSGARPGAKEGSLDPDALRQALALLGDGAGAALGQIRAAEIERRAIDRKIAQKTAQIGQIGTGRTAVTEARVRVEAAAPTTFNIRLTYELGGASWRPLYDARLDTETGRVNLVQLAEVRQKTGEDWSQARLTLSTARPGAAGRLPELATWVVDFGLLEQEKFERRRSLADLAAPAEKVAGGVAAEPNVAQVVATEFAAQYQVPGIVDLSADGEPHNFVIAELPMDAQLALRAIPKITPGAFLYGELEYEGDAPLLPGPVAVYRDGVFAGRSALALLRPGEKFELSFGVDDRVRVDYRLVAGERSLQGLINKHRRMEWRYRIEVVNYHKRAMKVSVLDQLPVARDERIKVELLPDTTPVSATNVDERRGVLAWTKTYEPGEEQAITFAYAVTYPEGGHVAGF